MIAGRRFDPPRIGIFDNDLDDADMLLGADDMRPRRFWLSDSTRQIFIQEPSVAISSSTGIDANH